MLRPFDYICYNMENGNMAGLNEKVDELKHTLQEEQQKNSINNAILEGGTLIIWAVNEHFKLISFNQNYFNFFFDDASRSIGLENDGGVTMLPASKLWQDNYEKAISGKSVNIQISIENKGKTLWKEVFLNPIYSTTGEISGVSGLAYDITEKMNAKLDLIQSEKMFRNIFESFQDVYFRCNLKGTITMLSPSVKDITGYTPDELLGKQITNFYLYKSETKTLLRELSKHKSVRNVQADLIHKSGKIIPSICNIRILIDEETKTKSIEGVARDITELSEKNKLLLNAKEVAENSLKVKERFLANMSHEIRTPLNGIIGMTHLLEQSHLDGKQHKHVKAMKSSADILLNILNDLLDISKIEAGKMMLKYQSVPIASVLDNLQMLYEPQAKLNNIHFSTYLDPGIPEYLYTDDTKIFQVFSNLISNALKFTNEGGSVEVRMLLEKLNNNGQVEVRGEVSDTGIGITEKDKKKLFASFTQLDSSNQKQYKGTGLGLYLSKKIINLFNGNIGLESNKDRGSTFWFTFESSTSTEKAETGLNKQKKIHGTTRVLLVDDNKINLELAEELLMQAGCLVTAVDSGLKAVHKAEGYQTFDLIIMDIQMPDMDGVATAKQIRKHLNKETPPIVAMTAYSMKGDEKKYIELGFDDYVAKPIDPAKLIDKAELWSRKKLHKNEKASQFKKLKTENLNGDILFKLAQIGGDQVVLEALDEFDKELDWQLNAMKIAFKEKNITKILNILHTIKGNAGTLGVNTISKSAELFENELKREKYYIFESSLNEIERLHTSFKEELSNLN